MSKYDEKRNFIRYALEAKGQFVLDDDTLIKGKVDNISIGGYFLAVNPLPVDDALEKCGSATFSAYVNNNELTVEAYGRMVRITQRGIGIFFENMDSDNKKRLHQITKELSKLI